MTESNPTAQSAEDVPSERIGRRGQIAGMTGLGLAGALGATRVFAQDATPDAPDAETEEIVPGISVEFGPDGMFVEAGVHPELFEELPEIGAAYDNFVGKLAANLGQADAAVVDTAIRDALKAMVDEQFDEGTISRNLATELKERIDSSEAPLMVAMLGGFGLRRIERRRRRNDDDETESEEAEAEATASA